MKKILTCKKCGCEFETNNHRMRYCTYDCKEQFHNLKRMEAWANAVPASAESKSKNARKNALRHSVEK